MAQSKRGPASVPAQPTTKLSITLSVDGFRDDCVKCCQHADRLRETCATGLLYAAVEHLRGLAYHRQYEHKADT